jgi:EmrB/QacA subfamily drug resistance transporter
MTRRQLLGTILVMTGTFVAAVDVSVVGTAMPTIIGELGGIDRYGWVFSGYLLASTAMTPVFGRLADMFGRKPLYFGALVTFVAFSMLAGTSRSMDELIVYRALQGIGAGALLPTGFTMIADLFDRRKRAKVAGLFGTVWVGAAIVGPAIGGAITQTLSWRWTFYVNLPIGLIALALLVFAFRDSGEHHRQRIDWLGAAVFTVAATALMLGLNGVAPVATVALALALALLFVRVERTTDAPLIDLDLVRDPLIAAALALTLASGVVQFGVISYVPPFVQGVLGGQPAEAGFALAGMSVGWSVGATVVGWILFRFGVRSIVTVGSLFLVVGILVLALVSIESTLAVVLGAGALVGLGMGWTSMPVMLTVQTSVGYAQRGAVTGLIQFSRTLGGAAGVAALGSLLNARLGPLAADASVLLDPLARRTADASAVVPMRAGLADGLHAVYVGMLAISLVGIVLARRLPVEMPEEAERGVSAAEVAADQIGAERDRAAAG